MFERLGASLSEANKWAQESDGAAIAQAFRDIAFSVTKLALAMTYFLLALADILVGSVENVVNRGRGNLTDRREKKLKTHLDWDRAEPEARPGAVLRR